MKPELAHHNEEPKSGPHSAGGSNHPAREDLLRFMAGHLSRPEARAVVRHLLAGCSACVRETRRLWRLGEEGAPMTTPRTVRQPSQAGELRDPA